MLEIVSRRPVFDHGLLLDCMNRLTAYPLGRASTRGRYISAPATSERYPATVTA